MNESSTHYRSMAMQPGIKNPKAVEMHVNATHFVRDGEALGQRGTAGQFFLFIHGIELALKSFLHDNGRPLPDLYDYGHKLEDLLEAAESHGLVCSESDTAAIVARLNKANEKAKLRYEYEFAMPLLQDVARVARGILKDTEPVLPPLK